MIASILNLHASTQVTNTETFSFIAVLVFFKLLSRKVLFKNKKQ